MPIDDTTAPPHGADQSEAARAAYRKWIDDARQDGAAVGYLASGTGVWAYRTDRRGITRAIAAHIIRWNALTRAYYVVPDHDPHRPFFTSRVDRRYVGEVAPGVQHRP
ncbi:MAG: hypothetical protein AAFR04_11670 [Pseudomonadota bacterium]